MPTRKTGDPVVVYVERDDGRKGEYRNGSVIKLVRGYGYEVMTVDDNGEQKQGNSHYQVYHEIPKNCEWFILNSFLGTFTFAHVKAIGSRNRSRSRGRKSTVNIQTVKPVKREESPSPEREEKPIVRKSRARATSKKQTPSADMNPVDYAWANVAGEAEGRARVRRSRSRSRGRRRDDVPIEVELLQDSYRVRLSRVIYVSILYFSESRLGSRRKKKHKHQSKPNRSQLNSSQPTKTIRNSRLLLPHNLAHGSRSMPTPFASLLERFLR